MQEQQREDGVTNMCASCGGEPGGLVWEGLVLRGVLRTQDIVEILHGTMDYRGVSQLFASGRLRGSKLGKFWTIRASRFIEDWDKLESRGGARARRPRRPQIIDVPPVPPTTPDARTTRAAIVDVVVTKEVDGRG